jgi:exodeoxyribonuclease VII small subunit
MSTRVSNLENRTVDIDNLSFEQAFQELEGAVQQLEAGNLKLEESLELFERGTKLAAHCGKLLDQAELHVRQLVPMPKGGYELEEYDRE